GPRERIACAGSQRTVHAFIIVTQHLALLHRIPENHERLLVVRMSIEIKIEFYLHEFKGLDFPQHFFAGIMHAKHLQSNLKTGAIRHMRMRDRLRTACRVPGKWCPASVPASADKGSTGTGKVLRH